MIVQVPELADGGYWYVAFGAEQSVPDVSASGWSATINGDVYRVYRTEQAVLAEDVGVTASSVVQAFGLSSKPVGRVFIG